MAAIENLGVVDVSLDLPVIENECRPFGFGPEVLLAPAVESCRVRLRSLVEGTGAVREAHRHQRLRIAGKLAPGGIPGLGVDLGADRAREIGEDVEVVNRALDHQRVGNLVAERSPGAKPAGIAGEAADEIVELSVATRPQLIAQRRFVLVEPMAHGDAHLFASLAHLPGDPHRRRHGVRDRFLGEDVEIVGERGVDNRLMRRGRDDDR